MGLLLLLTLAQAHPLLVIDHGPGAAQTTPLGEPTGEQDGTLQWQVVGGQVRATIREFPGDFLHRIEITLQYTQPTYVRHEALVMALRAESGRMTFRDAEIHALPAEIHLDRWAPKYIELHNRGSTLVLWAGADIDGMSAWYRSDLTQINLELDDTANHPFFYEAECRRHWRKRGPSLGHSTRFREAGETVSYVFFLGSSAAEPSPLLPQRFPGSFRAAFALADHADQTSFPTLQALLYGSSNRRLTNGGLLGHGLPITKALFFDSRHVGAPQLEDPRVQELAKAMVAAGFEVVPHTATPRPDSRQTTAQALRFFSQLGARDWIDHQVETNCEAFTAQGWKPGDPFYIADLLASHGVRYLWSGRDTNALSGGLDLLATARPQARGLWLFPFGPSQAGEPLFWLWRSIWAYVPATQFFALYGPAALDRLEADQGLHIGHTYLESLRTEGHLSSRSVIVRQPDHSISTGPGFEQLLRDLARRMKRGSLWVAPVGTIADHTLDMSVVDVVYQPDGLATLSTRSQKPVRNAAFLAEHPVTIDGAAPEHAQPVGKGMRFWLDIEPGRTYRIATPNGFLRAP